MAQRATFNASFVCSPSKVRKSGEAPIEVSLSINGKRTYIQLPKKCKPEEFDSLLNSKTDNDIKTYCQTILAKINEIQTNLTINGEPITPARIKDYFKYGASAKSYTLQELFNECLAVKRAENGALSTYRKYKNVTDHFYEFTHHKPTDEVSEIKNKDIVLFRTECTKKYEPCTVAKELQYLKYYFTYAFLNGKISVHPFGNMKIKSGNKLKPFLRYDEICKIRDLKITNDRLDKVRDVFLFMCFTGLEYADMEHLQKEDVKKNKYGQLYIKKGRIKTGIEYTSILYEDAEEIWKLYDGELPLVSNVKLNLYLKEIGEMIGNGWDKNLTTLTARHTYACYLLNEKKISMEIVQKMLGHTNLSQTKVYAQMLDSSVFEANAEVKTPKPTTTPPKPSKAEIQADMDDIEAFNKLLGI